MGSMLNWSNWKIIFQIPKRWNIIPPWSLVNMKMGSTLEHTHSDCYSSVLANVLLTKGSQKKVGDWIIPSQGILKEYIFAHLVCKSHHHKEKTTNKIFWIKLAVVLVFYLCHIALNKINRFFFGVLPSPHVKSPLLPLLHHSCSRTIGKTFSLFIYRFTYFNLA